jgi:hypothetical protein
MTAARQSAGFYTEYPWKCSLGDGRVEIKAYVEKSAKWETILEVHSSSDATADALSGYISEIINESQARQELLEEAKAALELIEAEGITFSSEHAADRALSRIKKLIG